jgi:thioredoxin 1
MILTALLLLSGCERTASEASGGYVNAMAAIGGGRPVMLEVGADYCTACQAMKKMIDALQQEHPDAAIYMINANKEREAAGKLGVKMIPTQIFYDASGEEIFRHVGGYGEAEFHTVLRQYGIIKE